MIQNKIGDGNVMLFGGSLMCDNGSMCPEGHIISKIADRDLLGLDLLGDLKSIILKQSRKHSRISSLIKYSQKATRIVVFSREKVYCEIN